MVTDWDWDKFIQHNMTLYRCMISDIHDNSYVLSSTNLISNTSLHVGRPLLRPFLVAYAEATHSVESPSTVDPQWDIWYWGSKWNLHTVCWSAVGCERGPTTVYFGMTYVCFIPSRLPVFAVEPQYLLQDFLFLSKVSFEGHIQNLQKNSCWFKIWMGFVGPKLIKLWTSSIWGFL